MSCTSAHVGIVLPNAARLLLFAGIAASFAPRNASKLWSLAGENAWCGYSALDKPLGDDIADAAMCGAIALHDNDCGNFIYFDNQGTCRCVQKGETCDLATRHAVPQNNVYEYRHTAMTCGLWKQITRATYHRKPSRRPIVAATSLQDAAAADLGTGICGGWVQCAGRGTWQDAEQICMATSARLCTSEEVLALGDLDSTGLNCTYDHKYVWTATPCETLNGKKSYVVVGIGFDEAEQIDCIDPESTSVAFAGQCCGETVASECPCFPSELHTVQMSSSPSAPAPTPPVPISVATPTSLPAVSPTPGLAALVPLFLGSQVCGGRVRCAGQDTWQVAQQICNASKARLCTSEEARVVGILDQVDVECEYIRGYIWTSTSCEMVNGKQAYVVIDAKLKGHAQEDCIDAESTNIAFVGQCCGEVVSGECPGVALTSTSMPRPPINLPNPKVSVTETRCKGFEEEFRACDDLPPCRECTRRDCEFGDWSDWIDGGSCARIESRKRSIKVPNNECGTPCNGAKEMTRRSHITNPECKPNVVNCKFDPWGEWSKCGPQRGQSYRERNISRRPEGVGEGCNDNFQETKPCDFSNPRSDCQFGDWHEWTACSVTCGTGRHTKMRRIISEAVNDGQTCEGATLVSEECGLDNPCPARDCKLSAWSDWSPCRKGSLQRFRSRGTESVASGSGMPCKSTVKETVPCFEPQSYECLLSAWSEWTMCDQTCNGGQKFRMRTMEAHGQGKGLRCTWASLEVAESCNTHSCDPSGKPCKVGVWSDWSSCSSLCDEGSMERTRQISQFAVAGGQGCNEALKEVKACTGLRHAPCGSVDCVWGDWYDWSPCSSECGGGAKRRSRTVKQAPQRDGKLCPPLVKNVVVPCNIHSCNKTKLCADGKWGPWGHWSECSASCDEGYRFRNREVAQEASQCGQPLVGARTHYSKCPGFYPKCTPDEDCELSAWSDWSVCSCTCFGVMERSRFIAHFVSGYGNACNHRILKEVAPCYPKIGETASSACGVRPQNDCAWGDWGDWTECDRPCGGGRRQKFRKITHRLIAGGLPCEGPSLVVEPCHDSGETEEDMGVEPGDKPCVKPKSHCEDCRWSAWDDWSACTATCGGQRYRHRAIMKLPNICGKPCSSTIARETIDCTDICMEVLTCRWTDWNGASECGGCAPSVSTRNRFLGFSRNRVPLSSVVFTGSKSKVCTGAQVSLEKCETLATCPAPCVPQSCVFAVWGEWGPPSCEGLCERKRTIATVNNHCGKPCSGALLSTKKCISPCTTPEPCTIADWSDWTKCSSLVGQQTRERMILKSPRLGGKACEGALLKTRPCAVAAEITDCVFGPWDRFSACTSSCGGGVLFRTRRIDARAASGGEPCRGPLRELQACHVATAKAGDDCPVHVKPCTFTHWGDWSGCAEFGQRHRLRRVLESLGRGKPCEGSVEETETCDTSAVDCVMGTWTQWDACDKTCGGGQHHRQRQIQRFSKYGGRPCESTLMQTRGCNEKPCHRIVCGVTLWSDWSTCSVSCGSGQMSRTRSVENLPCDKILEETRACYSNFKSGSPRQCDVVNCKWHDWSDWSGCTCTCDGGMRARTRHIKNAPMNGGTPCLANSKEEVQPCNTYPCPRQCIDGSFGPWSQWTRCSATCGGGTQYRSRGIAVAANECGKPPAGKELETLLCNVDLECEPTVNCEFSDWGSWSDCSMTCYGVSRRERRIKQYGHGKGQYCIGALKEVGSCNPKLLESGIMQDIPEGCDGTSLPRDCELSDWEDWTSECSSSCGDGVHSKSRSILTPPRYGGKACPTSITNVTQCEVQPCDGGPTGVDCVVGQWHEWGACYKCGGVRKRFRHVLQFPKNGGKHCPAIAMEEISKCDWSCPPQSYCTWEAWGVWGQCSATCGAAARSRKRHLKTSYIKNVVPETKVELMQEYHDLLQQTRILEGSQAHILIAFYCGGLTFVIGLASARSIRSFVWCRTAIRLPWSLPQSDPSHGCWAEGEMLIPKNGPLPRE